MNAKTAGVSGLQLWTENRDHCTLAISKLLNHKMEWMFSYRSSSNCNVFIYYPLGRLLSIQCCLAQLRSDSRPKAPISKRIGMRSLDDQSANGLFGIIPVSISISCYHTLHLLRLSCFCRQQWPCSCGSTCSAGRSQPPTAVRARTCLPWLLNT